MASSEFVHLHLHSEYSLLDGAIKLDALFDRAKEFGMSACALTDHGNMHGAIRFYMKALAKGIKPIIGCEIYLAPGSRSDKSPYKGRKGPYHLILLAMDEQGYGNLCRIVSLAALEGFYHKPRADRELLERYSDGLIAMSSCLQGEIPRRILEGDSEGAEAAADFYRQTFSPDRFYLELQSNDVPGQDRVNAALVDMSRRMGIPIVATNDCHYLAQEDARAHDILLCVQTKKTVSDEGRLRFQNEQFYFRSPSEMAERFRDHPEALRSTLEIAERCNLKLELKKFQYPDFKAPGGKDLDSHLREIAGQGLERKLKRLAPGDRTGKEALYRERLEMELDLVTSKGYSGYFLIVLDFVDHARTKGIPVGPGRGLAAGSLLSYCLGITDLDPIRYGLLFERFLNPERPDNPDMDIDFCARGREEIIHYVADKYGRDRVAQICAVNTLKARGAVRDVGRALGRSYGEVDVVAKLIPEELGITLEKAVAKESELREKISAEPWVAELIEISRALEGLSRHVTTHAAGVVISNRPLIDCVPLTLGQQKEVITQYDKDDVEEAGLIKFDFLGLKTLTVIEKALELIERNTGTRPDLDSLTLDDPAVFDLISRGDTTGIFQLEDQGKDQAIKMRPSCFEDLIALVAIIRPGPMGSGMIDDFIDAKHGRKQPVYELPAMREILEETYGLMVYQEQVMEVVRAVAGFSLGESELLRKAIGKKKAKQMAKYEAKFMDGAAAKGIDREVALGIMKKIMHFAQYGFNKSHSAAYALLAYRTAYLKAHHPLEFMAALMTLEVDNSDKIMARCHECKQVGIEILPPDINASTRDFNVENGRIRFGLAGVKNLGEGAIEIILKARKRTGGFESLCHFCEEVEMRRVNRRAMESLIKAGGFDSLCSSRSRVFAGLDPALEAATAVQRDRNSGQQNMFGELDTQNANEGRTSGLPEAQEWGDQASMDFEKEALGFFLTRHPLENFYNEIKRFATHDAVTLQEVAADRQVAIAGIIASMKPTETRKGRRMAFCELQDPRGSLEIICFPECYEAYENLIRSEKPIVVRGTTESYKKEVRVIANKVVLLENIYQEWGRKVHLTVQATGLTRRHLEDLKGVMVRFPGKCEGYVHVKLPEDGEAVVRVPDSLGIDPSEGFISEVEDLLGKGAVFLE